MIRLRPYKPGDAKTILSWCRDENELRKWTSDRYEGFPVTPDDMNRKYLENNGDCPEEDNFFPMTATDERGNIAGHLIMRYTDSQKSVLRFGFVIVDNSRRGTGLGRKMISLALKYAFCFYQAEKVTLGAFQNNMPAYYCYKAAGFRDVPEKNFQCRLFGETWTVLEMELTKEEFFKSNHRYE